MVETKSSKLVKEKLLKNSKSIPEIESENKLDENLLAENNIYADIVDRTAALGLEVVNDENEGRFIALCKTLIAKLESIDAGLAPLAKIIDADSRVKNLLLALYEGSSFDDALTSEGVDVELFNRVEQVDVDNSLKCADKFCSSHNLQDYEAESFVGYVRRIASLMIKGEVSEDLLEQLWRSFAFDNEISQALVAGISRGKNMKIDEIRSERENNDGLGNLSAGAVMGKPSKSVHGYIEKILQNRI